MVIYAMALQLTGRGPNLGHGCLTASRPKSGLLMPGPKTSDKLFGKFN